ncbi:hypothetical protein SAMN05421858_3901 [Haladaptatus litoreus]|uniref:DUF7344 domain-containing protein n=1 Tax=Haladaptatus litoreus TaxID=553468 RepID=A0A1N7E094_9EURY|nr:hypothetical protein [Haladaptatus litoreus]SIR81489.1 hypothetical protein SAMN05421858_3901 [Haladaptatus litoreus]
MSADSEDSGKTNEPPDELSITTTLNLLTEQRRRLIIDTLQQNEPPLAVADLAKEVTIRENDTSMPEVDDDEVLRTYMSLYHNHIPRLVDAEVVEYEQERDVVGLSKHSEQVADVLSAISDSELRNEESA